MLYFASYITRITFSAVILEAISDLNITKNTAAIITMGNFLAYGIGQIISGYLGDKIKPKNMIFVGLFFSGICNIIFPFMPNILFMTIIWCINGFFQSMIWPPTVRFIIETLPKERYKPVVVAVSASAHIGAIALYLITPLLITFSSWKTVFFSCAAIGILISLIWFFATYNLKTDKQVFIKNEPEDGAKTPLLKLLIISGVFPVLISTVFLGIIRDSVAVWTPNVLSEVFKMSNATSILTAVVLPVFTIIHLWLASAINKRIKNEMLCGSAIFVIGLVSSLLLAVIFYKNALLTVFLLATLTGSMNGVNLILISRLSPHFVRYGNVSTVSGILNMTTYLGSGFSVFIFASLSDKIGWIWTVIIWSVICVAGALICGLSARRWGRFRIWGI